MTPYHKSYSQVSLVSLLFSTNSKLILVLCLCSWCSWTSDKLLALCWVPEPCSDLQTLGHILPLPSLSLLCTVNPTAASKPSTSVGSLWCQTEKVLCLVELCFLCRLLSLWGLESRLKHFYLMSLSIKHEVEHTVAEWVLMFLLHP